ncbi:sugar transport protein 13-like [Pyrus ussuriensis x Pyrus communis]|uniref:Sugar transport protein 13-like n=1 Tax=Pyrus ussuriensis x Pyrus communis TaxID=2448454 RepID=A0A5N5HCN4_9ROSA|nr:sugar transport protein 13-like [Pyrus ussuriensis x Pyrus communis]
MFGYDIGISGGVTSMPEFLKKFFPIVYQKTQQKGLDSNCFFNAAAQNLLMLIIGRILLGCGVGNQAVPLFLSEIAPTRIRGALNILFRLNVTIGILFANLTNYGTSKLSLALAGIPAAMLTLGSLIVVDTPNSLIARGKGVANVEPEFLEIVEASRVAKEVKNPFQNLLKRRNTPLLNFLFQTVGFRSDASLYSAVITGAVNVPSTVVSIYFVDKAGRRVLLLDAGVQMFLSQLVVAIVMGLKVQDNSNNLTPGLAILVVVMVCCFASSFAWSCVPLGWLIPSETFPLEARSAGQSVAVCINMLFTFIIAQAFLSMLCHMKFGIFLFFTAWVLVMTIFVTFLIPETKGVPIEEMTERVWKQDWFWKRFMDDGTRGRA